MLCSVNRRFNETTYQKRDLEGIQYSVTYYFLATQANADGLGVTLP